MQAVALGLHPRPPLSFSSFLVPPFHFPFIPFLPFLTFPYPSASLIQYVGGGALKSRDLTSRDWTTRHQLATVGGRRELRSADVITCHVPRTQNKLGDRAYQVAGPRLWNSLPPSMRLPDTGPNEFKRLLKTHHGLYGSTSCCISHGPSQSERAIFDPPQLGDPSTDFHET